MAGALIIGANWVTGFPLRRRGCAASPRLALYPVKRFAGCRAAADDRPLKHDAWSEPRSQLAPSRPFRL